MGLHYYVIDLETTGLKPTWHEVTQISIIRYSDRNQFSKYIRAQYPDRASAEALEVTGRTKRDLYQGESKKSVVDAIDEWIAEDGATPEHRCMVGHNCSFDRRFSHDLWGSLNKEFPAVCWLDTKPFARQWAVKLGVEKPKLTLMASLEFTGIKPVQGAIHNAITDARNCYLLLKKGMDAGIDHLEHIKRHPHNISGDENPSDIEY